MQWYSRFLIWVLVVLAGVLVGCRHNPPPTPIEITRLVVENVPVTATPGPPLEVTTIATTTPVAPSTDAAAAQPTGPRTLTICLGQEPVSLYPHAGFSLSATHVWQAIYENLYTNLDFGYQAVGLAKLPSLEDGDARLQAVAVDAGDMVVDVHGFVVRLGAGVTVNDGDGGVVTYAGTPLTMSQLVVDFTLRPLIWSDGVPVTADDVRFSFELKYGPNVDLNAAEARIAAYEALDAHTIRYTSLPGGADADFLARLVPPLPRHQLGDIPFAQVAESEAAARLPLANGPFMLTEWLPGDHMTLVRNPNYYRADEGLPRLDGLTFLFTPNAEDALARVLAGTCDVATQESLNFADTPLFLQSEAQGLLRAYFAEGPVFEHIDFGVVSASTYANKRPDWFSDVRVRQAMTQCTNRQQIIDETQYGKGEVMNAYVSARHPLYPADLAVWPFDVNAGNALLDEVGYLDGDGDGVREDPQTGEPFQITLLTTAGGELRPQIGGLFQEQIRACGIDVLLKTVPAGEFFADGPVGPVFGRQFDLALFSWLTPVRPPCNLYLSGAVPGPPATFAAGWAGLNVTGWSDTAFDAACAAAAAAWPGTPEYVAQHQEALRIFAGNVPAIPILTRVKVTIARPTVQNLVLDTTQQSELWNLYAIDLDGN